MTTTALGGPVERIRRYVGDRVIRPRIAEAPYDTSIRLGAAALVSAGLAIVAGIYSLGPTEPQVWFYSRPLADATVVLMLAALALAAWSVATAASVAPNARPLLAVIALLSCGVSFSVVDGATGLARSIALAGKALPSVRVEWSAVPSWTLGLMVASSLIPAGWLVLPGRLLGKSPVMTGLVISVPLWITIVAWGVSSHVTNVIPLYLASGLPTDVIGALRAPRSASALRLFSGVAAAGIAGWLVILILLSGSEFARAQVALAGRFAKLRVVRRRITILAAAVLVLIVLVLGYLGVFGSTAAGIWRFGSGAQWSYCVLAAVAGALALGWEARNPVVPGRLRSTVAVAIVALGLPSVLLVGGSLLQLVVGPIVHGNWAQTALDWGLWLQRYDSLVAVVLVAVATAGSLRSDRRLSTGTMFGIAFVLWGFPSAVQVAVSNHRLTSDHVLASPQRLVVCVCLVVLVVAVGVRDIGASSPLLAQTLIGATISAFGIDAVLSGSPATAAAVLLVILPVAWRFLVDTREERENPAWKSVLAMATWATLISLAAFTIGAGAGIGLFDNGSRLEWNLLIVPLTFALLCQTEPVARPVGPGWRGGSPAIVMPGGGPLRFATGVVAAALIATSAVLSLTKVPPALARPPGHQVTMTVPSGWTPGQCDRDDAEIASINSSNHQTALIVANAPEESLRAASTDKACYEAVLLQGSLDHRWCEPTPSPPLTDLPGFTWYTCASQATTITYAINQTAGDIQAVLLITLPNASPPDATTAQTTLTTLTFN
ncbi:hypothetical protein [Kribbella sp. NPDC004536]|uniref:hypothetical protein n=1 Tax=Kribbella sp. NPDC004536 TaxID=3364106 RepID=UPI00368DB055